MIVVCHIANIDDDDDVFSVYAAGVQSKSDRPGN